MPRRQHPERHAITRIGWLRAAVLGANDGLLSTASLILGVAAASAERQAILVAGVAGLVAGSMSMAAGEYVSVSSQRDAEQADIRVEKRELKDDPAAELDELTGIYIKRGVAPELAREVAKQLTAKDALAAHARDELGVTEAAAARPVQAAMASAASFAIGAVLPLAVVLLSPPNALIWAVGAASLVFLAVLGALGAWTGGAKMGRPIIRVVFWGALALAVTAGVGKLFGVSAG
jgi:VIT1/CCC1 family predicted Fe2+/Mn2+ transporter